MTQASTDGAPISLAARVAQIVVVAQANAAPSPPRTAIMEGQPNPRPRGSVLKPETLACTKTRSNLEPGSGIAMQGDLGTSAAVPGRIESACRASGMG